MAWQIRKYPMYPGGIKQIFPGVKSGTSFLSKSVVVGNLIFVSGLDGRSLETGEVTSTKFEEQLVICLDNIRLALEETGSSLNNLARLLVLLKNYQDASSMWKTMLEYYQKYAPELVNAPPAITVTQVEAVTGTDCLVEIAAIAVLAKDTPGWEMKKYPMYYGGVKQVYPNIEPGKPFLSESVVVGNLVFLSAMAGEKPDTGKIETNVFEQQWQTALDKVSTAMDNAGSSLSNVIKTLHFQCRVEGLTTPGRDTSKSHSPASDRLWKTELEYYDMYTPYLMDEPPGSTFIKVSSLANPDTQGQTEVIGVLSRYKKGEEVRKYPTYLGLRGFPRHIGEIKKYYANTVKVGSLLFVSGQTPTDIFTARIESSIFEEQITVTLDNLRHSLEETGSALENLVMTYILLPNPAHCATFRQMALEHYQKYAPALVEEPPASIIIHPLNLASPSMHVEIDAIAYLPTD